MPTMLEATDERIDLIAERVAAGEREAYSQIIDACQDRVRAAVGGFCSSAEEVEEVCHVAFIEAYRKIHQFDSERGSFMTWLLTISRNCMIAEFRRKRSSDRRIAGYIERIAEAPSPIEDVERARAALEQCLAELDPGQADLIAARYTAGRTSDAIARTLDSTAGAVRKVLQRLREKLKTCVERRMADTPES